MDLEIVDDLRQPEYTGENRCAPCTVLNLAIAAIVGSLIARKSRVGGALAVGLSVALIYLRGYLVPGTPTLTKRYLPPEVLRWFGKEPEPEIASGLGAVDGAGGATSDAMTTPDESAEQPAGDAEATFDEDGVETADADAPASGAERTAADGSAADGSAADPGDPGDLEAYFLAQDVLEPCEDRDDLCLTDAFEEAWLEEIEALEDDLEAADAVEAFGFEADADEFEIESREDVQLLVSETGAAGRWPSRAALLADVGASRALESWTPDWDARDPELKGQVLNGLRMFLETCPTGGSISMTEETVESCCTSHEVFAVVCEESGERLFEQRLDAVDA